MNEIRIYTKKLAEYLTERGFYSTRTVQSITNPKYKNWMFKDSPELRAILSEYRKNN